LPHQLETADVPSLAAPPPPLPLPAPGPGGPPSIVGLASPPPMVLSVPPLRCRPDVHDGGDDASASERDRAVAAAGGAVVARGELPLR
jgi:hypothetical protein